MSKTITIQLVSPIPLCGQYSILCDRTAADVMAFAREHPKCFVLPFVTGRAEDCPDYTSPLESKDLHIMQPFHVGNLSPLSEAIRQIVAVALSPFAGQMDCIVDEAPRCP